MTSDSTLANFLVKIGFKTDEKGLKHASKSLTTFVTSLGLTTAGLSKLVNSTADYTRRLKLLESSTGLSTRRMQDFSNSIANLVTNSRELETVNNDVAKLQENLNKIKTGQADAKALNILGISLSDTKDAIDLIEKIENRVSNTNPAQSRMLLSRLGLSREMIDIITSGDRVAGTGLSMIVSPQNISNLERMQKGMHGIAFSLKSIKNFAVGELSEDLESITKKTLGWVVDHKEDIRLAIQTTTKGLMNFISAGSTVVSGMIEFTNEITQSKIGLALFTTAVGVALVKLTPLSMLFSKTNMIVAGLLYVIDDIIVTMKGGDSIIRGFIDKFQGMGETSKNAVKGVSALLGAISVGAILKQASAVSKLSGALSLLGKNPYLKLAGIVTTAGVAGYNYIKKKRGGSQDEDEADLLPLPAEEISNTIINNNKGDEVSKSNNANVTINVSTGGLNGYDIGRKISEALKTQLNYSFNT
jgi:hypothetical protein